MTLLGKTRGAVLGLLLGRPDEEFHVRQVARLSGASLAPAQRELKVLARVGVLKCRAVGRQLLYAADPASPVYEELRGIVAKTVGAAGLLAAALRPLAAQVRVAFLFGSVARGEERASQRRGRDGGRRRAVRDGRPALAGPQRRLGREVNPTVYRPAEFADRLAAGHHFLTAVLAAPKVYLVGDEHELSRVAEERLAAPARHDEAGGHRPARRRRA